MRPHTPAAYKYTRRNIYTDPTSNASPSSFLKESPSGKIRRGIRGTRSSSSLPVRGTYSPFAFFLSFILSPSFQLRLSHAHFSKRLSKLGVGWPEEKKMKAVIRQIKMSQPILECERDGKTGGIPCFRISGVLHLFF